jgi:crotonobetainyl-CoA:carnitine CoA-transferase CaiB-like acyl-CoA transferase
MAPRPLEGIRVVEFVHMVMGPACGLVLADLGADVIKVEPAPDGDNTRRLTASGTGFFSSFNRNKRSLAVNLKSVEGMALVRKLIATADVVCENFRPGAMDKLGLGWEALQAEFPRLIYCSLKGFLPGPYEHRTALDEVVQMMGGLAYMTGMEGKPMRAGSSVNDIMGGMFGAIGVLAALRAREQTGQGQLVQSGLFENNMLLMSQHMSQFAISGQAPKPMGSRDVAWPIYDLFDTADGEKLFVGVVTDTQWRQFAEAFGLTALLHDPALLTQNQRRAARATVLPVVAAALKPFTIAELVERLEKLGLPYSPVAKPWELFEDPHLNANGGTAKLPNLPLSFNGERLGLRHDLPKIGANGAAIAAELGFTEAQIAALRAAGALV